MELMIRPSDLKFLLKNADQLDTINLLQANDFHDCRIVDFVKAHPRINKIMLELVWDERIPEKIQAYIDRYGNEDVIFLEMQSRRK